MGGALLSLCRLGLIVWLLVHYRRGSALALSRLESLRSSAQEDRALLGGALSATSHTLDRLVERMYRVDASIARQQETEATVQYGGGKVAPVQAERGRSGEVGRSNSDHA